MKALILVAAVALFAVSCSEERREPLAKSATGTPSGSGSEPFDRLTITLRLPESEVRSGGQIQSEVTVENGSGKPVTDPGCQLYAHSYALLPVDQPDADLWGQVVVDCSGPNTMQPGFKETSRGPTFQASDKYGESLPAGDYLAVMELEGSSMRFSVPVTVTEE